MKESTLDLITRKIYYREIDDSQAIEELKKRGWNYLVQHLAHYLVLLITFPERLLCEAGGDNWDNGPTQIKDIVFSIVFSAILTLPFIIAWKVILYFFGTGDFPTFTIVSLFACIIYCRYIYK